MRQVFGEWGVVTETKSASYGILSAPVANNIRGYLILCQGMFSTYILSQLEISFFTEYPPECVQKDNLHFKNTKEVIF